jgi:hypothetical protein
MKLSERILIREASRSLVAWRPQLPPSWLAEHLQVVGQRAHPRRHLFFLGAGQEADVLADGPWRGS